MAETPTRVGGRAVCAVERALANDSDRTGDYPMAELAANDERTETYTQQCSIDVPGPYADVWMKATVIADGVDSDEDNDSDKSTTSFD